MVHRVRYSQSRPFQYRIVRLSEMLNLAWLEITDLLTADRETHARQRRLMSHAFSEKALREQEPILQLYASRLCEELQKYSRFGPVDMKDWFTFAGT